MPQTAQLTAANLLTYPSEKLARADDGGGVMRGTPLTGAVNELFDPTSDVELVNGGFDARLIYPAVLTNDLAKLYGAYVIVGERPEMPNISVLLFGAAHYGEYYKEAKYRIESYSAPTIESRMTLMGKALSGSKIVQCYQRVGEPLPLVGERYCLKADNGDIEYFRVGKASGEERTFTDPKTNQDFQRLVVTIQTTDVLENDHQGAVYPAQSYANAPTKVLETQIADSARFVGIRPLVAEALQDATTIQVDSLYEQLVPTTTTDTAWADQYPAGVPMYIPTGALQQLYSGYWSGGNLYLPSSVQPGSVELSGYTDEGRGLLVAPNGSSVEIDYAAGVLRNLPAGNRTISAIPAARVSNSAYSSIINIDQTNQSTEWAPYLTPKPAPGSTRVSFLSGGQWYDLIDNGDYILRDSSGKQRGTITRDGSCVISLPDMPDAGSKIVVMWSPIDYYFNLDGQSPDATLTPVVPDDAVVIIQDATDTRPIKPGTLTINAAGQTATDDGTGTLIGDYTGTVDYAVGAIRSADITAASITLTAERFTTEPTLKRITPNSTGSSISGDLGEAVQPGSLMIVLNVIAYRTSTSVIRARTGSKTTGYEWTGYQRHGSGFLNQQIPITEALYETGSVTDNRNAGALYVITDDQNGGLLLDGRPITGAINYTTGIWNADLQRANVLVPELNNATAQITNSSPDLLFTAHKRRHVSTNLSYEVDVAAARYVTDPATTQVTTTVSTGKNVFAALKTAPKPAYAVYNSWRFEIDGDEYVEREGVIYDAISPTTGNGNAVGEIDRYGNVALDIGHGSTIKILAGVYVSGGMEIYSVYGRTPAAPVLPQSFYIRGRVEGATATGQAQADGSIAGDLTGNIAETTGFYRVESLDPIQPETIRFNVTTQSFIPLPKSLIGIDTVRLRPDGKAPIYRLGDTVVIHNRAKHDLGTAHTAGATVSVGRDDVDFICVKDASGQHVEASKYDYDLDAGTITWASPLDLSAYTMPLTAYTSREQLNRITSLDINGTLGLQNPLGRTYPAAGTHVSSALVHGTLEATWTNPFEQQAWTDTWADERIGDEILAKLNTADYPITVTNDGAITERWLIKFKSGSQFYLIGENIGLVAEGDTLTNVAPINPATGKPYFTIPAEAFGTSDSSIWAAGNCIRFNTTGTSIPVWLIKTVQPSTEKQTGTDGFDTCLRGNTTKI